MASTEAVMGRRLHQALWPPSYDPGWPAEARRLGAELRQHRKRAGLTMAELAERAHLSETMVGDLERGNARTRRITMRWLPVLTEMVLDVLVEWEAARRLRSAALQERIENMTAAEVSKRMGMAR